MRGFIYREPADLLETGERSKGNKPGINTITFLYFQQGKGPLSRQA